MTDPVVPQRQPNASTGPLVPRTAQTGMLSGETPPAAPSPAAPVARTGDAWLGEGLTAGRLESLVDGLAPHALEPWTEAPEASSPPAAASVAVAPIVDPRQRALDAANWLHEQSQSVIALRRGNATPAQLAQVAGVLRRPEQLRQAREALAPIANTEAGILALDDLNLLQGAVDGQRSPTERRIQDSLIRLPNRSQSLAGIQSEQGRQDLEALATGNPRSLAAFQELSRRPPGADEFPAGQLAVSAPARIGIQDRLMAADPRQATARDAMLRQAVQGLADAHFRSGGATNPQDAHARLDAGVQTLRDAGVDGGALDRARQAVLNDPSNQTMLRNPGLNAAERLLMDTGSAASALAGIEAFLDRTVGKIEPGQRSDGLGPLSQLTDRIPPGESRTLALEGEARFGVVELGAGAEMTIGRTQPPDPRLRLTFTVAAHAAVGFEREFSRQTPIGGVTGKMEAQARADGRASFTYEFNTNNPQEMAQLRSIAGAVTRSVPGIGGLVGGTEGPGLDEAFRGLAARHTETRYDGQVSATVRIEATATVTDRPQQLVARYDQARAALAQVQAVTGSLQTAYGALGHTPPDFQAAFGAMQPHLPAGSQLAGRAVQAAQQAQALYAEGKHAEALALFTPFLPPSIAGAVGQAQGGVGSLEAVQTAFGRGDLVGGLTGLRGAVTAGQGLVGSLRQQVADFPGQIQAARAAVQTVREAPAQLQEQVRGLPGQASEQVRGALAAPTGDVAPVGTVQLMGSLSAHYTEVRSYRDNTTTATFGFAAEGSVSAESRLVGQTGTAAGRAADVSVTRGADGQITGVSITRRFEGSRFAATAGRELVGHLDPQVIARVDAKERVEVVQQLDMAALGITPDLPNVEVARRLASLALSPNPPAGHGRVTQVLVTRTEAVSARVDLRLASIALRLDRTRQRTM